MKKILLYTYLNRKPRRYGVAFDISTPALAKSVYLHIFRENAQWLTHLPERAKESTKELAQLQAIGRAELLAFPTCIRRDVERTIKNLTQKEWGVKSDLKRAALYAKAKAGCYRSARALLLTEHVPYFSLSVHMAGTVPQSLKTPDAQKIFN